MLREVRDRHLEVVCENGKRLLVPIRHHAWFFVGHHIGFLQWK